MSTTFPLVPARTALVLVEFQNEWLEEGRPLHALVSMSLSRRHVVERARALREELARRGGAVVHAPLLFEPGHPEIPRPRGLQIEMVQKGLFVRGTAAADFGTDFRPRAGEIVARGRTGLSAFSGSDLDARLQERGIDTLVIAGFATNVCVEYTAADAFDRGYTVILAKDAAATFDEPRVLTFFGMNVPQTVGEKVFGGALGEVLTNRQILERLPPPP